MSGGLIQKLEQAEIQRDKYKRKFQDSETMNKHLLKTIKALEAKLNKILKVIQNRL